MESSGIKQFIFRNWFKVAIALFLIFILLKKDLSFQVRLKAPAGGEDREPVPVEQLREPESRERLTDSGGRAGAIDVPPAEVDRFEFPSIKGDNVRVGRAAQEFARIGENVRHSFLERFAQVAVGEREKFGIPASLILGNALLISQAGKRDMSRDGNNYFAIHCTDDWDGSRERFQGTCYRRYENAWTSFRDHSLYVTTGERSRLRRLDDDDYKGWARGLEMIGFYEEEQMADLVIQIIEEYRLYELDRE